MAGRQFAVRRKDGDVFSLVHSGSGAPILSELDAVRRSIAYVYLALPTGSVQMAPMSEYLDGEDTFQQLTGESSSV
jgi:hypothetical protein